MEDEEPVEETSCPCGGYMHPKYKCWVDWMGRLYTCMNCMNGTVDHITKKPIIKRGMLWQNMTTKK